jgi:hypothetical protein
LRRLLLVGLSVVLLGGACAEGTTPDAPAEPEAVAATECIDAVAGEAAMMRVSEDSDRAIAALERLDPSAAALSMRSAVRNLEIAARATEADPAASQPLLDAARETELGADAMDVAAETMSVPAIEQSTEHVKRAAQYIQEGTAALEATTLPGC